MFRLNGSSRSFLRGIKPNRKKQELQKIEFDWQLGWNSCRQKWQSNTAFWVFFILNYIQWHLKAFGGLPRLDIWKIRWSRLIFSSTISYSSRKLLLTSAIFSITLETSVPEQNIRYTSTAIFKFPYGHLRGGFLVVKILTRFLFGKQLTTFKLSSFLTFTRVR